ncbi:hypothetical protein M3197_12175 [Sporosarcina aquimarina]|nr:hypothetical protein [Sporosarcina aquimarina]MCM3758220.1 hypothetical protein [Sporosarcina aquimarina]
MENEKTEFTVNGNKLSIKKENQTFEIRFNTNEELGCFLFKILSKKELIN